MEEERGKLGEAPCSKHWEEDGVGVDHLAGDKLW